MDRIQNYLLTIVNFATLKKESEKGFGLYNVCAYFGPWIEYKIICSPLTTLQLFGVFRRTTYNARVTCLQNPLGENHPIAVTKRSIG